MSNQIQTLIQVELEDRNRLTAFFRLIIVLPVAIYFSAFAINSYTSDNWSYSLGGLIILPTFLALVFRGIYPSYALSFNHALISLETRVNAYVLLLTDDYPSIEENDIVKITLPEVGNGSEPDRLGMGCTPGRFREAKQRRFTACRASRRRRGGRCRRRDARDTQ